MKETIRLMDEVKKLILDLSKFKKGRENLDKLLGNQRLLNDKMGLGFEEISFKNIEEKSYSENAQVNIIVDCIGKALKNIFQIGNISGVWQANSSNHALQKEREK